MVFLSPKECILAKPQKPVQCMSYLWSNHDEPIHLVHSKCELKEFATFLNAKVLVLFSQSSLVVSPQFGGV